jgi:pyruvate/2-oxoacid:ferredoxin oxidoreductase beta subunit
MRATYVYSNTILINKMNTNHNILQSVYNNQSFYNTLHQYTTTCTGLHTTTVKTALRYHPFQYKVVFL